MNTKSSFRSAATVRIVLIVVLTVASALGAFGYVSTQGLPGKKKPTQSQTNTVQADSTTNVTSFTSADSGSCLNWDIADDGSVSKFEQTDCASEHRYEISVRENLATYPSSEFGPSAQAPDMTRQAQLREELCKAPTIEYLKGKYDPVGRYSIAPILPPPAAWASGDRTMLCGVQVTNDRGQPILTTGKAADQDQARIAQTGQCVSVDAATATHIVSCDEDHAYEVTSVVDLLSAFPNGSPTVQEQDDHLKKVCSDAALQYLGNDDALYNSTLHPFWTTIPTNSWAGGTHTVNCALTKANNDHSFTVLKGSAKGNFTIDGAPPPPQPSRNPLRQR